MAADWDPRTALGIVNVEAGNVTCFATIRSGERRCQRGLSKADKDEILSRVDDIPGTAPANATTEEATLREIAEYSFCSSHYDVPADKAVREWQRALTAERAALARTSKLSSRGIGDVDDLQNDNTEPCESPETKMLRKKLARVTPELNELRQQVARATPEADVEDLRKTLERATLEGRQVKQEKKQIKRESEQFRRDSERFRLENEELRRRLDAVKRASAGLDAEPKSEEGRSSPLGAHSEQSRSVGAFRRAV